MPAPITTVIEFKWQRLQHDCTNYGNVLIATFEEMLAMERRIAIQIYMYHFVDDVTGEGSLKALCSSIAVAKAWCKVLDQRGLQYEYRENRRGDCVGDLGAYHYCCLRPKRPIEIRP